MRRVVGLLVACALTLGACRGEARQTQAKNEQDLARLVDSLEILAHALHPDRCSLPPGVPPARRP